MIHILDLHRRIALKGAQKPFEWVIFLMLMPLAVFYGTVMWVRNKCYDWHIFPVYKASVPVISVGNLAAGGTGKTPIVDWLLKEFLNQGKRPAVISRGYGGTFTGAVGVVSRGDGPLLGSLVAGDESVLLSRRNPQVNILIARKRAVGIKTAVDELAADVVILDDGFQHRAVQRDVDLVLLDATHPRGNGWPLPAGLLREFPGALKRSDLLLLTRSDVDSAFTYGDKPVFTSQHQLAERAISLNGEELSLQQLGPLKLFAFAGIAAPNSFFSAINAAGLHLRGCLPLSDHCQFDQQVQDKILTEARGCDALITTEKDAVKLTQDMFTLPCYQVPMNIIIDNEDEFRTQIYTCLWSQG